MQMIGQDKFVERLVTLCPSSFAALVDKAARQKLSNRSQYIRQAILRQLEADGIGPAQAA